MIGQNSEYREYGHWEDAPHFIIYLVFEFYVTLKNGIIIDKTPSY